MLQSSDYFPVRTGIYNGGRPLAVFLHHGTSTFLGIAVPGATSCFKKGDVFDELSANLEVTAFYCNKTYY